MDDLIFETKTFLQTVRVFKDRVEIKEPLRTRSIVLNEIASIDTGLSPSYDFFIVTSSGNKFKMLVKSKEKQKLKDAIFLAKAGNT